MMSSAPAAPPSLRASRLRLAVAGRVLVDDLSLEVGPGTLCCVLGPNGSGKSTLLHTLAGLRSAQSGTVTFEGRTWSAWHPREAAKRRGLLLQHASYAFSASVAESVLLGRYPHIGRFGRAGDADRRSVRSALAAMDLAAIAERDVLTLSGGERQRVEIATLLAQDPALFLLDEPTAHLDLVHQIALFRHLTELARTQGRAVIVATHEYNLATRFATHACLLYGDGRTTVGRADEVLQAEILSVVFAVPLAEHGIGEARILAPRW
jgi:iron complex transport system ATP-binding protein